MKSCLCELENNLLPLLKDIRGNHLRAFPETFENFVKSQHIIKSRLSNKFENVFDTNI